MRYHDITFDDMLNGDGLRVVLWLAGCEHHCDGCQNPVTWDVNGGIPFDEEAMKELFEDLSKNHIAGLTLSGGDPLHPQNRHDVSVLLEEIKRDFPDKNVWMYTGYKWEDVKNLGLMKYVDVLVDDKYIECARNTQLHWVGSSNQRVIDAQNSLSHGIVILKEEV